MVGHRSTGLPECGPTESSAPEPCFLFVNLFSPFFFMLHSLTLFLSFIFQTLSINTVNLPHSPQVPPPTCLGLRPPRASAPPPSPPTLTGVGGLA